jgi:hypothetical protein
MGEITAESIHRFNKMCELINRPLKEPRKHARKIKGSIGPFQTACVSEDGGRQIEIVRITPLSIVYRVKGKSEEYTLKHETAYLKAVCVKAGFDASPRTGRISRSEVRRG